MPVSGGHTLGHSVEPLVGLVLLLLIVIVNNVVALVLLLCNAHEVLLHAN